MATETTTVARCPSIHIWSDAPCIREAGHEGVCWSKAMRGEGTITRIEWWSRDGKFLRHHQYDTKYPTNAARPRT